MNQNKNDIIIVGCGLSGMITALALAHYGISTTIIEARSHQDSDFFDDIRTTAINATSYEFFKKINIWAELKPNSGFINDIYVADNKAEEMLHFSTEYTPKNEIMGYLIENSIFKKSLFDLVSSNKNIKILENTQHGSITNNQDGCVIEITKSNSTNQVPFFIQSKLLIACDGKNSKVKNLFFSNELEQDYNQNALTFIVEHDKNHEGVAVEHFMPDGPFAILPLKDCYKSSIVWTMPKDNANIILKLQAEELNYLVRENFGEFLGAVKIISEIASFPIKAHGIKKYYNKSIALVADTAHIIHPLAGQGLNQGIKDIESLSRLIYQQGISSKILETYQKERKSDNENMLLITDTINSIFGLQSKTLHAARQVGFKTIENITPFKKLLIKYAMGKR